MNDHQVPKTIHVHVHNDQGTYLYSTNPKGIYIYVATYIYTINLKEKNIRSLIIFILHVL